MRIRKEKGRVKRASAARSVRYFAGFGAGVKYGVHTDSLVNLARGIVERVFYVVRDGSLSLAPRPRKGAFARLGDLRTRLLKKLHSTPVVDRCDYSSLYTGRKRLIYERAYESLMTRAIELKDSFVSTFVKAEKVNFDKKPDPAPRVIQPRTPRYNLEVGRYLKLFEHELCLGFKRLFGYDVILKGKNATGVAEALRSSWDHFNSPVAVGLDASRFDQHVSVEALQFEHSIYNTVFRSPELARLLKWQLTNRGIARVGEHRVDYSIDGCRMSGDINTGMGNCLLMSCIVIAYCEHVGIDFRLANNGDDCVLFVDDYNLTELVGLDSWFLDFGFTLTRETPCYVFEHVEFCQAHPISVGDSWRMVRDPRTAMSKDCVSLLGWDNDLDIRQWAGAIGTCGLVLTSGVPVWSAWYQRLVSFGVVRQGAVDHVYDSGLGYMSKGVIACEITPESRVSFWRAFGILPDMQIALEADYREPWLLADRRPMTFSQASAIDRFENPLSTWLLSNQP